MLVKRSATEMERVAAQAGCDGSRAIEAHRQWLHVLRENYKARVSRVPFASDVKVGDALRALQLDRHSSDEGDKGDQQRCVHCCSNNVAAATATTTTATPYEILRILLPSGAIPSLLFLP